MERKLVKFIRPSSRYAYKENSVTSLTLEDISFLNEDPDNPVVQILPDDYKAPEAPKKPEITADQMERVRWLNLHPKYAYNIGDLGYVLKDSVMDLISADGGPFIEILPEDWEDPSLKIKTEPEEMISVIWLKAHYQYSYKAGDKGKVAKSRVTVLVEEGYVKILNEAPGKPSFLNKILFR